MVNTVRVIANNGHYFRPLAGHKTKLLNFAKGETREFSAFPFSLQVMFAQTLSNSIVCLMISQTIHTKEHKRASMLQ